MKGLIRELRLIPLVAFAAFCLLALKVLGLAFDGGYIFAPGTGPAEGAAQTSAARAVETVPAAPSPSSKVSWARDVFGYPGARSADPDVTGSMAAEKPAEKKKEAGPVDPPPGPNGTPVPLDGVRRPSPGERAVLESLQTRRQELEQRAREIDIRENLLKAAEKRLEERAAELKEIEARINGASEKKAEANAQSFKSLVAMYENMKAKDAAKIFDRLDMKVLLEVASQIKPRTMSEIMAQMSAEAAEKLTTELARKARGDKAETSELPKIEPKPGS
jgi:flagellar motility protein MotE (MotC chaperone)